MGWVAQARESLDSSDSTYRSVNEGIEVIGFDPADEILSTCIIPIDKMNVYQDKLVKYRQKVFGDFDLRANLMEPQIKHAIIVLILAMSANHGGNLSEIDFLIVPEFPFITCDEVKLELGEQKAFKCYTTYTSALSEISTGIDEIRNLLADKLAQLNKMNTQITDMALLKSFMRNQNLVYMTIQNSNRLSEQIELAIEQIQEAVQGLLNQSDMVRRIGAQAKEEEVFDFTGIIQRYWPVPMEVRTSLKASMSSNGN